MGLKNSTKFFLGISTFLSKIYFLVFLRSPLVLNLANVFWCICEGFFQHNFTVNNVFMDGHPKMVLMKENFLLKLYCQTCAN